MAKKKLKVYKSNENCYWVEGENLVRYIFYKPDHVEIELMDYFPEHITQYPMVESTEVFDKMLKIKQLF